MSDHHAYVVPPSYWPALGTVSLALIAFGAVNWLHDESVGPWCVLAGFVLLIWMMAGWFRAAIRENNHELKGDVINEQSYRLGMVWFIFSEVMFFAAFFAVLWYVRVWVLPWLSGQAADQAAELTHYLLWPEFTGQWPVFQTPDPSAFIGPEKVIHAWGIPALNTLILLSSGVTITVAHWGVVKERWSLAIVFQALTIFLALLFLSAQAYEYWLAHTHDGLKLSSGIYGSTFYMLTGFHGLHVFLGTIMLIVILGRLMARSFTAKEHFAFEAVAWYWHFVDVVWLALFVFVYWI